MHSRFISALCGTASLLVLASMQPAAAQQAAQPTAGAGNLEEIVVTARKREERIQTVPLSITAFSQADLEKAHVQQLRDLGKDVPSFSVSTSASDPNGFYSGQVRLRGLAGSWIYFADVPLSDTDYSQTTGLTKGLSPGFYYDLDHVEVDLGPQGTLFGRPSIGGIISLEPKRPTNDFEGYVMTTFGNYGDKENEFAVNIPIVEDKLMVRVAGQMQQRDGYTLDLQNGQYLDNRNYYAWRIGVTFRPTDDFENYLVYDGYWQDSDGSTDVLQIINPNFTLLPHVGAALGAAAAFLPASLDALPLTTGNGPAVAALFTPAGAAAALAAGGVSIFPTEKQIFAEQQALGVRTIIGRVTSGIGKDYLYGFTDIATWDVNDNLTIKNIAAARITKQLGVDEFTNSTLGLLTIGWPGNNQGWTDNSAQYTDELQIHGKALADRFDWQLGGFIMIDHPIGYNTEVSDAVGTPTWDHFDETDRSQAIFAHGIYDLSDWVPNLRFTAGYRFTWDYDSLGEVSTKPVDTVTYTNGIANNCNLTTPHDNNCHYQVDSYFNSPGWNLGLDYQLNPDTLLYVRSGNAYRPGGTNLAVPAPFNIFHPEHVTDVELGVKMDWEYMDVKGRTNFDGYYTTYKSIQVSQVVLVPSAVPGQPGSAQSVTANAATAYIEGLELSQKFAFPFGIDLEFVGDYSNSHFDTYPTVFGQVGTPGFQYVPRFQFHMTPTYHVPIPEEYGDLTASITWQWYGHQLVSPLLNEPINYMQHYEDFDVRIDWNNILGRPYDLAFWMTNATNNTHIVGEIPLMTSLGFTSGAYDPPRMFGFTLKMRFGPGLDTGLGI